MELIAYNSYMYELLIILTLYSDNYFLNAGRNCQQEGISISLFAEFFENLWHSYF